MQRLDNFTRESRLRFGLGAFVFALLIAIGLLVLSFAGGSIH